MSVPNETSRNDYSGNDATTVFPYQFKIYAEDQLRVVEVTAGVEVTLVLDVDYSVSGVGDVAGGDVTLLGGALATGKDLIILRVVDLVQGSQLSRQSTFDPSQLEQDLDEATMMAQQLERDVASKNPSNCRYPRLKDSDTDGSGNFLCKSNRLSDVEDPVSAQDAATKAYVDAAVLGAVAGVVQLAVYTTGTQPAATALSDGMLIVKDPGQPAQVKVKVPNLAEDGYIYETFWISIGG